MFGLGKGEQADEEEKDSGIVRARIEVQKVDRYSRNVKAIIWSCSDGTNLYKAKYTTKATTDFYAYNFASEELKRIIEREEYVLDGEIATNAELPYVRTVNKRTRY